MIRLTPATPSGIIASGWGAPRAYRGGWHAGVDFPAPKGTPILAAAPGTVAHVKNISTSFAGKHTIIDHGGGIFSRYLHADRNLKKKGDKVRRGEQIAIVGTTGTTSSAPHLHFDLKFTPEALTEYQRRFGQPTTGFSATMKPWGRGAPVEALMDGATYRPGVVAASQARGVAFYQGAGGALGLLGLLGAAGAIWWFVRRA